MLKLFDLLDVVKVVDSGNKTIKEGIIVELTSRGARVYQPKCDPPFSDNQEFAEWFPFNSAERKIILGSAKGRKIKS